MAKNQKYLKYSKEQLIDEIEIIKSKKEYGITWEPQKENVIEKCKKEIPLIREQTNKSFKKDKKLDYNFLIEGDNYHALSVLNYTHPKSFDLIYIDPPYNTGNNDFYYNDNFVSDNDSYKHSKWLSFMSSRLELASKLLSNDGLFACSIDDNEFCQLKLLMDKIFKEKNIKTLVVKMSEASGLKMTSVKRLGAIPKYKEFLILAKKGGVRNLEFDFIKKSDWDNEYNIFLENFTLEDKKKIDEISQKKEITDKDLSLIDNKVLKKVKISSLKKHYPKSLKDKNDIKKWNIDNAWRICRTAASPSIKKLVDYKKKILKQTLFCVKSKRDNLIYLAKSDYLKSSKKPRCQLLFAENNLSYHPGDIWSDISTTGLNNEGGVEFSNGKKPLQLMKRIIKSVKKKDALILDFFAGSASTVEAILQLNKEDGGTRKYVVCENNPNSTKTNIVNDKCLKRIKNVSITGYGKNKPIPSNLKVFKTFFIERTFSDLDKIKITKEMTDIICFKENKFNSIEIKNNYKFFSGSNSKNLLGILFNLDDLNKFIEFIKNKDVKFKLYIFSLGNDNFEDEFYEIRDKISIMPIPSSLLEVYKKIFK